MQAGTWFLAYWPITAWQVVHRKWDLEGCPTLCASYVIGEDPPACSSGAAIGLLGATSR